MKKIFLLLFIVFIGCSPKATKEALKIEQNNTDTVIVKNDIDEINIHNNEIKFPFYTTEERTVNEIDLFQIKLPYNHATLKNYLMFINNDGTIEYNNKTYIYKDNLSSYEIEDEISLIINEKNNLCGIFILEQGYHGTNEYTIVINTDKNEEVFNTSLQKVRDAFCGFAYLENLFLVIYITQIFSYDNTSGELVWTQTFLPANYNRRYNFYENYFVVDEMNGNEYKVYMDGRKEYIQGEPLDRIEHLKRLNLGHFNYVK